DSEFTNNKANGSTYSGGVFELYCGVNGFVFENVRFINNTAHEAGVFYMGGQTQGTVLNKNATFIGVNFTNNSAYYGGVFSSGSTPPSDLYFYDCNFDSNNAQVGGVFEFSTSGEPFGRGYVFNNTNFTNNIASEGGIIYTFGALVSDITFNHTNFINNTAENYGGGIIDQGSAYLPESAQNSNIVIDNCNFTDNYGADGVMGLSSGSKDCKILNSNFESNDGGVGVFSILRTSNNLVVDNCNFTNNSGTTSGAFYFLGSCINLTVSNSNFENNTVDDDFDSRGSTITFASRYSSVFSENNTFVNVTFKNNTGNNGGAVWIYGENTNFTNVSFINNTARKQGGAVYTNSPSDFTQGMDTFTGCTFEGNEAEGSGAAIYSNYQQIGLKDSNFTNNSGKNIVYIGNFGGNVSNCNFTNNTCEEDVIHQSSGPNGLNISGSTFEDNIAGKQIVYVESNSLHVSDSNFTNNTGNAIKVMNSNNNIIEGSSFKNHNVTDGGAAIYLSDSDTNISGSTFENNTGEYGGAIFASNSNVNISGSTFLDNHANNGGAINIVDSEMVSISDSNFRYNTAYHGSAINFEGVGSASVNDSNFSDNHVIQLDLIVTPDSYTMSIMANLTGGNTQVNAIYSDSDMVSYSNVLYLTDMGVLNTDEEKSIYLRGVPYQNVTIFVYDDEGNFLFNLTNLTDNKGIAMFYDLGLEPGNYSVDAYHYENTQYAYAEGESEFKQLGNFTLLQILIDNTEDGGTLDLTQDFTYSIGLDDDITEGIIINKNITINGNGHFIDALYKSRIFDIQGLYYDDPDTGETILLPMNVHLTNMTLLNGNSDLGGAVHASYINNLTIDYCDFINNTGTGKYEWVHHDGWVLGSADSAAVALDYTVNSTISDCSFINNTIYNDGVGGYSGALSIYGINNTITRCEFINNSVWNYGGAIGIKYGSVNNTIENSIFENNSAWYGGAIYSDWSENSTFRNLTFKNNTADNGGAMYLYGSVNTVIEDSVFENNNNASEYSCGGAIYALPYSMLVKNSTFKNNTGVTGGAIYLQRPWDDSFIFNITIEESKFIDNNVTSNGGAIGLNGIVNFTVKDSQFINNSAVYGAGALSIDGSRHLSVEDSEFINNSASLNEGEGGAIRVSYSDTLNLINNVFESNFAAYGGAISFICSGQTNVNYDKFRYNVATNGSALYLDEQSGNVFFYKSEFLDNKANASELFTEIDYNSQCVNAYRLTGNDNYINAIYSDTQDILFEDVDYWAYSGIVNSNDVDVINSFYEIGQTIIFEFYDSENNLVKNDSARTNMDYIAKMPFYDLKPGVYTVRIYHPDDTYYTYVKSEDILIEVPDNQMGDFDILQKLIDELDDNQVLKLSRDFTYTMGVDEIKNGIEINSRNITIDGNGKTINALNQSRIFNINGSDVLIKNLTFTNATAIDPETNGGAVYINSSDVIMENVEFINNTANNGSSLYVESGKLDMSDSILNDKNSIYNDGEAILTNLVENAQNSDYVVYNGGTLSLNNNTFNNLIKNNGTIITKTYINVLNNAKIGIYEDSYLLTADVTDDNGNIIELSEFSFIDEEYLGVDDFDGTHYSFEYNDITYGAHIISASTTGLKKASVKTATLIRIQPTDLELSIEQINNGEKVNLTAKINPSVEGNITIMVNNIKYPRKIDKDGMATLTLENLIPGTYNVLATYPGSELYMNSSDNGSFVVKFNPSTIILDVDLENAIVKAIVTEGATGNVTFIVDGVNYTRNVGEDLVLDAFAPGVHNFVAIYNGDELYAPSNNNSAYLVDRFISQVTVSAENVEYGNDAVIVVEVPESQTGSVTIWVNDESYTKNIEKGRAEFNISGLTVDYYPIAVLYNGDSVYDENENASSFNVTKGDLGAKITAPDVTTSQNTSFILTVPDDFAGKVKITVDGITYDGNPDALIQMANLTAGDKKATVQFYGDSNYKNQTLTVEFNVRVEYKPVVKNESSVKVEVKDSKIVASVANGVTGNVTFIVNDREYSREIVDGKAVLEDALVVGNNSIVAYYPESDDYNSSMDSAEYELAKLASLVKVSAKDISYGSDAVIDVEVPDAQTGTVTITVGGKNYT
ncbi:MAG: Ig-like domain repeat protein, partial [Methanobrevibacter sp.]|nr:Ig-like domain repeat protein [Methanobrevibacter sp.]